jgi:hypothetical protein
MSFDVVQRVNALIALASSPNRNEAESAAYKACQLIREHKLVVTSSTQALPETSSPAPSGRPTYKPRHHPQPSTSAEPSPSTTPTGTKLYGLCRGCGARVSYGESTCVSCASVDQVNARHVYGSWHVECQTCGARSPSAPNSVVAAAAASMFGYRVVDGRTVCPACAATVP